MASDRPAPGELLLLLLLLLLPLFSSSSSSSRKSRRIDQESYGGNAWLAPSTFSHGTSKRPGRLRGPCCSHCYSKNVEESWHFLFLVLVWGSCVTSCHFKKWRGCTPCGSHRKLYARSLENIVSKSMGLPAYMVSQVQLRKPPAPCSHLAECSLRSTAPDAMWVRSSFGMLWPSTHLHPRRPHP